MISTSGLKSSQNNTEELIKVIIEALQDKKARNIVDLNLENIDRAPAKHYVVCHAGSDRAVEAAARNVEEEVEKQLGENTWHKEGFDTKEWILIDYVDVVVHIFIERVRDFYALEELWADAEIMEFEENY